MPRPLIHVVDIPFQNVGVQVNSLLAQRYLQHTSKSEGPIADLVRCLAHRRRVRRGALVIWHASLFVLFDTLLNRR